MRKTVVLASVVATVVLGGVMLAMFPQDLQLLATGTGAARREIAAAFLGICLLVMVAVGFDLRDWL